MDRLIRRISDAVYECPSFVDTHSHDDIALIADPARDDKRLQGVGVQIIGNCGISAYPRIPANAHAVRSLFDTVMGTGAADAGAPAFDSIADYRRAISRDDIGALQGYNAVRAAVAGQNPRPLDTAERERAQRLVAESVDTGAVGLSFGLAYLPALGADFDELVAVARLSPLITVHLRNESTAVLESVDEAVKIARHARCRLHISHLKIAGKDNWPVAGRLIEKMCVAHDEIGATFDQYPYAYGCTAMSAVLPPEISALPAADLARVRPADIEERFEQKDWENYSIMCGWEGLRFVSLVRHPEYNGVSFAESGEPPLPLILKLLRDEPSPAMLIHSQDETIVDELLKLPFGCVGTDGLPAVRSHPRLTSSFPEFLKRARTAGLTPEQAIDKSAILPRKIFRIPESTGGVIQFDWSTGAVLSFPKGISRGRIAGC